MADSETRSREKPTSYRSRTWNWAPELPIATSPVFAWPPRPVAAARWLAGYWLALSATLIELALAFAVLHWTQPDWETMKTLSAGWILTIWLRNLALMILVAGGLHLFLYGFKAQGSRLKFDPRDLARNNGTYTFSDQVHDNMFWTLVSGVGIWTLFEVLFFWSAANGHAPLLSLAEAPVWFVLWFLLIPLWSSFHFYWIHRLLHWPPLYRAAHSLHHRNVNVGPWTGISMHPVEHVLYFSSVLIHFVVPSDPVHVLFHLYVQALSPAFSHSGFDGLLVGDRRRMKLGDFFHQLHHRYFECNYGTAEVPWDRLFGSFHDGTAEANERIKTRRRQMLSR